MSDEEKTIVVMHDQVVWKDNPTLAGGKLALLSGYPTKDGPVVMRFKIPANTQHQPHWHPHAELVTVLNGRISYGEGEKFESLKGPDGGARHLCNSTGQSAAFRLDGERRCRCAGSIRRTFRHQLCQRGGRSTEKIGRSKHWLKIKRTGSIRRCRE